MLRGSFRLCTVPVVCYNTVKLIVPFVCGRAKLSLILLYYNLWSGFSQVKTNLRNEMVLLDGTLCNQMTQYVFARCLQEEFKDTNELVLLDDLWYFCDHGALGHQM